MLLSIYFRQKSIGNQGAPTLRRYRTFNLSHHKALPFGGKKKVVSEPGSDACRKLRFSDLEANRPPDQLDVIDNRTN